MRCDPTLLSTATASALLIVLAVAPAAATENGATHYPLGTSTVVTALMPPPGTTVGLSYTSYYTAGRVNDGKGDPAASGFRLNLVAEGLRPLHTWTAFEGVSWSSAIVLVAVYADLHVAGAHGSGGGFGDLVIQPLFLSAAFGDVRLMFGFDVSLPTGDFDKSKLVNPGLNYVTYAPQAALTWFPTKEFELSLFAIAGFNSRNPATRYTSGTYVDLDYAVGYRPIPSLRGFQASVVGYMFQQVTDDTLNGRRFQDGHRGRVFAIGPQVSYNFVRGGVVLKWEHEMAVKNRAVGDHVQLQLGLRF
jgi:hypothetical protein